MPIPINAIRAAANRASQRCAAVSAEERAVGVKTAVLFHSQADHGLAVGMVAMLDASGWNVRVEPIGKSLPATLNRVAAGSLQEKIARADFLLILLTKNSASSPWCPWVLGYAEGKSNPQHILVIPTDSGHVTHGHEYTGIHARIDSTILGQLIAVQPGDSVGIPLREL